MRLHPFPGRVLLFYQIQDLRRRIIIVKEITLGSIAGHFLPCAVGSLGPLLQDVPLSRCRKGNPETLLKLLDPVERKDKVTVIGPPFDMHNPSDVDITIQAIQTLDPAYVISPDDMVPSGKIIVQQRSAVVFMPCQDNFNL